MKKGYLILVTLLLLLMIPLAVQADAPVVAKDNPLTFDTVTLYGKPLRSSILKNYDLIMVNYWAEWCDPCVGELPALQQIHKNYKNVLVLGAYVSSNPSAAAETAEEAGVTYPLFTASNRLYDYLEMDGGRFFIPQTCFFNSDGYQLDSAYVGSQPYDGWSSIVDNLLQYLVKKPEIGDAFTSGGLKYTITSENTVSFTGLETKGSKKTVAVPASVDFSNVKFKVTEIAEKALYADPKISVLNIGGNVQTIGKNALANCKKLKTVRGGAGVVTIKANAFIQCVALKTFPTMKNLQTIGDAAFKGARVLSAVTLARKVSSIGKNAFRGCEKLLSVVLRTTGLSAKCIGANAFKGLPKKAVFTVPKKNLKDYPALLIKKGAPKTCRFK